MSNVWYLDKINLYNILCPKKLKGYLDEHYHKFKKGDIIYLENQSSNQIYLVSKGKVKIVTYNEKGEELVKAILSKGELFGEKAILGEEKRKDSAFSVDNETLLCPLEVEKMYKLMRKNERFSLYVYKLIGIRLRKLERRLEQLFFKDSSERLRDFLSELASEFGIEKNDGITEIPHFYTQKDIADLIGTTRETVTKQFNKLKRQNILEYHRKSIVVRDLSYLLSKEPF